MEINESRLMDEFKTSIVDRLDSTKREILQELKLVEANIKSVDAIYDLRLLALENKMAEHSERIKEAHTRLNKFDLTLAKATGFVLGIVAVSSGIGAAVASIIGG